MRDKGWEFVDVATLMWKIVRYTLREVLTYLFGYELQNSSFLMRLYS